MTSDTAITIEIVKWLLGCEDQLPAAKIGFPVRIHCQNLGTKDHFYRELWSTGQTKIDLIYLFSDFI